MTEYVRILKGKIVERGLPEPIGDQSKLASHKPRILPLEVVRPTPKVGEVLEGPTVEILPKKVIETWIIRSLTGSEMDGAVEMKVRQVKDEARRRIVAIMPEHQQLNWTARAIELSLTHGADPTNWPTEDRAAVPVVLARYEKIKAVRAKSDEIEAALLALTKPADILTFDPIAAWGN